MKLVYTLKSITGSALFARFAAAINEDGVGHDNEGEWCASLSEDGRTWTTNWSRFTYTIVNPTADENAIVEYDGGFRGFLAQNLIPEELRGETIHAEVTEGSALTKHGVDKFVHTDAALLAEVYGLMQAADKGHPGRDNPFGAAVAAVEAARDISAHMKEMGITDNTSWCRAGNGTGYGGSQRNDRDPSVFVTCCPGGRQVNVEFSLSISSTYIERDRKEVVEQATAWLDRLRPTFDLAA